MGTVILINDLFFKKKFSLFTIIWKCFGDNCFFHVGNTSARSILLMTVTRTVLFVFPIIKSVLYLMDQSRFLYVRYFIMYMTDSMCHHSWGFHCVDNVMKTFFFNLLFRIKAKFISMLPHIHRHSHALSNLVGHSLKKIQLK